ncbi:hypothetical protein GCM10028807_12720 [Spirosoma daeguense]
METLFTVKYSGPFGFIKPWTAVRDSETFSQQFLTPSIIEGIEKKLFPELLNERGIKKITRHRLNYLAIDLQQEKTWAKGGFGAYKDKNTYKTNMAIIKRGVMVEPNLYLAFSQEKDALIALEQHICLCRNEDLLFPEELIKLDETQFDDIEGFELHIGASDSSFKVGYNRFDEAEAMFGQLKIYHNPIRQPISL